MSRLLRFLLQSAAIAAILLPGINRLARADESADVFSKKCASCHGKDGKGATTMGKKLGIKDLTDTATLSKLSDADIEAQIRNGAKDKDTGKDRMPAFKDKLSDEQIKGLVKYVRTLK